MTPPIPSPFLNYIMPEGLLSNDSEKSVRSHLLLQESSKSYSDLPKPCEFAKSEKGAHGAVYICDGENHVYKQFFKQTEYDLVKKNLTTLFKDKDFQKLKPLTCFHSSNLDDIFNDNYSSYKMSICHRLKKEHMDPKGIKKLINKFNNCGFIHGDIKLENIMTKNEYTKNGVNTYVLTDLDDMCKINFENGNLICSNTNEPMFTPVFVHPVYLHYRSFINSNPNKDLSSFIDEWDNTMYAYIFNVQAKIMNLSIFRTPLETTDFINLISRDKGKSIDINLLYDILKYSDLYSFLMCTKISEEPDSIPLTTGGGNKKKNYDVKFDAMRLNTTALRKEKIDGKIYNVYKIGKRCIIFNSYTNEPMFLSVAKKNSINR
jgi:hypothetical protein